MGGENVEDKSKPKEEYIKEIGRRDYRIKKVDEISLKEIEQRLNSGKDIPVLELNDYMDYLDGISQSIRMILQAEKSEGIANMDLERQLRKIIAMLNTVSSMLDKF